jgi:cytochrome c
MQYRWAIALLLLVGTAAASAQLPFGAGRTPPQAAPPDPATLFRGQCGICHVAQANGPPMQGPNLAGVYGRKAGTLTGFKYSEGFAQADFVWDEARLDTWLTNPQAMLPGVVMTYRQANPAIRKTIIDWLKEQH